MKRHSIRIIIAFATLLLVLLVVTQVFWVKEAYTIEQNRFSYTVTQVLLRTLDDIKRESGDSSFVIDPIVQVKPNMFIVRTPDIVIPDYLASLLESNFKNAEVNEYFVLNIYDCFTDSVIFCKQIDVTTEASMADSAIVPALVPPVEWNADEGHFFSVYFPKHHTSIFRKMNFWIYSSVIVILIILFFGYIISLLLKQKWLNEMKNDFINNMTHEFKTPIATIQIATDALNREDVKSDEQKQKKYASIIRNESKRLQSQVERILQAAVIEKENINIESGQLDLHQCIEDSTNTFRFNVESLGGKIELHLNAAKHFINGNCEHMRLVFNNLIDNAIKYSDEDRVAISIETENEDNHIVVRVSDKGRGIEPEHLKHIFEKFYRVPTGNVHNVKGYGIGLNYVKLLVEKHNGTIKVKSKPGEGTVFILKFPVVKNSAV